MYDQARIVGRVTAYRDEKVDNRVKMEICHNAPGIDPEVQKQIFILFYTTKKQGSDWVGLSPSDCALTQREHSSGALRIIKPLLRLRLTVDLTSMLP